MDLGIKGRRALVTGASKGLGLAAARALAAEGCTVAICARGEAALAAAAEAIAHDFGAPCPWRAADLSQAGAAAAVAAWALEALGGVDILVANSGGPPVGTFDSFGEDDWRRAVEMTLLPAQALARTVLPHMRGQGWGRVINLTSMAVKQPLPGLMLSNSIRAAVVGWAKTLADEVGPAGVTVNNVCMGWIHTERVEAVLQHKVKAEGVSYAQALEGVRAAVPLRRIGRPEELGDLVAFLASERASYVTGVSWLIDGGLHRGLL